MQNAWNKKLYKIKKYQFEWAPNYYPARVAHVSLAGFELVNLMQRMNFTFSEPCLVMYMRQRDQQVCTLLLNNIFHLNYTAVSFVSCHRLDSS